MASEKLKKDVEETIRFFENELKAFKEMLEETIGRRDKAKKEGYSEQEIRDLEGEVAFAEEFVQSAAESLEAYKKRHRELS